MGALNVPQSSQDNARGYKDTVDHEEEDAEKPLERAMEYTEYMGDSGVGDELVGIFGVHG